HILKLFTAAILLPLRMLGELYRGVQQFEGDLPLFEELSRWLEVTSMAFLAMVFSAPYVLAISVASYWLGSSLNGSKFQIEDLVVRIVLGIIFGMIWAIVGGGEIWALVGGIEILVLGIIGGIAIAGAFALGIAGGLVSGIASGIAFEIAFGFSWTRIYYQLVHLPFVWPRLHGRWYPYHPVAWDHLCG